VKKAALIAAAVVLVVAVGGVTYASARGLGPFARSHPGCPQAPCAPAERHCCGETAACQDTCKACPDFKDQDKDGACDVAGKCERSDCGTCPGHPVGICPPDAHSGQSDHDASGCGSHHGQGGGCPHGTR
jgi:hypothetical protein